MRITRLGTLAASAPLLIAALAGCDHVAKDMEKGIEKAVGVPQQKPESERAVVESYCYQGIGYNNHAHETCYRTPWPKDEDNRLIGSTYDRPNQ